MSEIEKFKKFLKRQQIDSLVDELEEDEECFEDFKRRTKEDWKEYYQLVGVDIYNYLHPKSQGNRLLLLESSNKTVGFDEIVTIIQDLKLSVEKQFEKQTSSIEKQTLSLAPIVEDFVRKYYYINDRATNIEKGNEFKKILIPFYFKKHHSAFQIPCMLSGYALPSKTVIAAHLFKSYWAHDCKARLGFDDINDPQNGLLLFKPFKYAFDNSHLCFRFDIEDESFKMKILKPDLKEMTIKSYIQGENEIDKTDLFRTREDWIAMITKQPHLELEAEIDAVDNLLKILDMKFSDFEGKQVLQTEERCFARCLSFQASMARLLAIENGWITKDELEPQSMFSQLEERKKEMLNNWFKTLEDS